MEPDNLAFSPSPSHTGGPEKPGEGGSPRIVHFELGKDIQHSFNARLFTTCSGGEIGRHARFRSVCLTAWGFESPPEHHPSH